MSQQAPCPKCNSHRTHRIRRKGFWQTRILSLVGRYPWECTACRGIFMADSRGKLKRHRQAEGEAHLPPVS